VARVAAFLRHRIVRAFLEKHFPGRGVRVVASRAGGRFHGVAPVLFPEIPFPGS
jgi:hypothetical protein